MTIHKISILNITFKGGKNLTKNPIQTDRINLINYISYSSFK